ncbi:PREDICTED: histone-lysine N-methyltransferase, H3 lysine-9 specific SUVH4-like [Populus euphratica]|uniref:Histone-lysine N-methyltransferase, H3 lysine-9 specific SUVH4-like n=1 Tax=Populus euphratica TaxID=75702 RepID=A0AAJ6U8H5_POPEU|nr:PREDICTED: histone-lysine N-methyltransferase, H3 lysine-9 specific SUVH4-like [Populus euphratica]
MVEQCVSNGTERKTVAKNGKKERKKTETQRRTSDRIKSRQREEKEQLVRKRVQVLDGQEDKGNPRKRPNVNATEEEKEKEVAMAERMVNQVLGSTEVRKEVTLGDASGAGGALPDKSATVKVKDTLRLFNKFYLQLVQEEELRCAKAKVDKKVSQGSKKFLKGSKKSADKSKKEKPSEDADRKKAKRPDLKAITKMFEANATMYPEKRIGDLPGISVGHRFYSRAEMVAVGFHSHWLNGIDYMGQSYRKGVYHNYTFPLAVAIVISGMYEDDLDNAEDVIYTGQGGHDLTGNKRQIRDQKLERGKLALKNCVEQCVPVRVVRGHECASSYCGKVYTYDGLYKVVQYWAEKGLSGFTVFKYRLRRLEGQPILTTNQVQFSYGRIPQSVAEIRGLVCEDISGAQEDVPIPATNLVDDPPVAPSGYTYCKFLQIAKNVKLPANVSGCNCQGTCVDPRTCACAKLNGSDFPYVQINGGRLIEARAVVFECGPSCGCGPGCVNRTSQRGIKHRLEVFRTPKKGWAVRSWDFIPSGAPVCEYIGALVRTEDTDHVCENNYIFDIDCLQTMRGLGGRERRLGDVSVPGINNFDGDDQKSESVPEFCIDAVSTGNIARFINHSCEPNLFVQCVLSSHHDVKLARVMLFAADNIPPMQELTYDYGYALDSVSGPSGKIKQMPCYCGAADCRKRLF